MEVLKLKEILKGSKPAVIAVDLHRGHMDPKVATMPIPDDRVEHVMEKNEKFFNMCRELDIPIIHQLTLYRNKEEILSNPYWRETSGDPERPRKKVAEHQLADGPGVEVMPSLIKDGDYVIDTKKRYNCFLRTDLEFLLNTLEVDTLLVTGVNTNSCVLATSIDGNNRDFKVIVNEDCVDSIDGKEAHENALQMIRLAFGWVGSTDEIMEALKQNVNLEKA